MKQKTEICRGCGKYTQNKIVIADDIENPRAYCKPCAENLRMEILLELAKIKDV